MDPSSSTYAHMYIVLQGSVKWLSLLLYNRAGAQDPPPPLSNTPARPLALQVQVRWVYRSTQPVMEASRLFLCLTSEPKMVAYMTEPRSMTRTPNIFSVLVLGWMSP